MYKIILKENDDNEQYRSELTFRTETLEETIEFINKMLNISNYRIEIIPPKE